GIAMMYCARAGIRPGAREKFWPRVIVCLTIAVAVTQQFTGEFQRSAFLNIDLPHSDFVPPPIFFLLRAVLLAAAVIFVIDQINLRGSKLINRPAALPLPAMAVLLSGALVACCGRSLSDMVWLFLPNFFHGSQYLAVMLSYQLKKKSQSSGI